ncbi:membrane protein insertase YidC [Campylobacter sp. MIT 12-5580]|uniref:membrane protein insertase YidC n=1 Tax=Campylobacter sp. MIT 12-5580 TaxID=2040651 RepID=UPI0010F4DC42|nr:membrane protein insertase YidC [Campylobacter sp. MIT 12-5580]TKX29395.1 membrane protein insertase YidC [Campylobacter sp. MIT 12-5580]
MVNSSNPSQQKRVILAVVLSFLFFIVYGEFFVSKPAHVEQNISQEANESLILTQNQAPSINTQASLNSQSPASALESASKKTIANIQSEHFKASIDELGRISSFVLKDSKYQNEAKEAIDLIAKDAQVLPLELRFNDARINALAFSTSYTSDKDEILVSENSPATLTLTQNLGELNIEKILTFYAKGNYTIEVKLSKNAQYFITPGSRPSEIIDSYTVHGALFLDKEDTIHTFEDGDVKEDESVGLVYLASGFDRYYTSLFYNFNEGLNAVISKDKAGNSLIFVSSNNEFKSGAYIGAKEHSILESIDKRLINAIEYGWFTFIAKPVFWFLNYLHSYLGNWGWAIVVLVLVIRLVLFPLTYKSMISMNKLKDLAPKMKEIRERYKGDPQKMNTHMMELYKKHGANPFAGCLPILLQIPIFFAIYRVLLNAIELKAAPWALWIHDLSVMDPYFILPIFMGATMFLQQLITPMAIQDPTQAKIMKFLPIIFTFFFITFPAGLTLYWCTNNLCSLLQQWVVNKLFAKEHHKNKEVEQIQ